MKKTLFAIVVFLVAFAVPVAVYSLYYKNDGSSWFAQGEEMENKEVVNRSPVIHSIPLTDAYVGIEYVYKVKASDADGDVLQYQLRKAPAWLAWDDTLTTMRGTPSLSDVGTHEVEIWVTDGVKVNIQVYQLDVSASQETDLNGDVQGVTSENRDNVEVENYDLPYNDGTIELERISFGAISKTNTGLSSPTISRDKENHEVLGAVTKLPDTAVFGGTLVLAVGAGVLAVGIFFWIDGKWGIFSRLRSMLNYERGEQISIETDDGVIVKKKQHKA